MLRINKIVGAYGYDSAWDEATLSCGKNRYSADVDTDVHSTSRYLLNNSRSGLIGSLHKLEAVPFGESLFLHDKVGEIVLYPEKANAQGDLLWRCRRPVASGQGDYYDQHCHHQAKAIGPRREVSKEEGWSPAGERPAVVMPRVNSQETYHAPVGV
jgi:hypothetical protein